MRPTRVFALLVLLVLAACAKDPLAPPPAAAVSECLEWRSGVVWTPIGPIHYSYCVRWSGEPPA